MFCFTPKGKLIALPRGATPIDFAYAVHTDVGNMAVGAKINGKIGPLSSPLQNGDEVQILTSKAQTAPPAAWESHRRDRQGARRDPARHPRRRPRPIFRARPAHRRTALPARQDRLFGREARRRPAAARARFDRRRDVGRRPRRDEGRRRRARDVSRLQGRAAPRRRAARGKRLVRPEARQGREVQGSGRRRRTARRSRSAASTPTCRCALRPMAARFPATASSAS